MSEHTISALPPALAQQGPVASPDSGSAARRTSFLPALEVRRWQRLRTTRPPRIIHHAPRDRPLCGNESSTAIYSDDPSRVAGCEDCLELVAEDLKDHGWYRGGCVNCLQEISAQGGAAWRRVVREPLLRPRGLVSMTTPTANWPELMKAVVLEVLGQPADPGV